MLIFGAKDNEELKHGRKLFGREVNKLKGQSIVKVFYRHWNYPELRQTQYRINNSEPCEKYRREEGTATRRRHSTACCYKLPRWGFSEGGRETTLGMAMRSKEDTYSNSRSRGEKGKREKSAITYRGWQENEIRTDFN